ncbi:hypothetical protein MXB_23, partial [Myxobolus squamalis]
KQPIVSFVHQRISGNFLSHTEDNQFIPNLGELKSSYLLCNTFESYNNHSFSIDCARFYLPMISCLKYVSPDNLLEYFHSIITITQSCLASTISHIEIINRNYSDNTSLFYKSIVESTNFRICSQLARFCYFTSGIAPTLSNSSTKLVDVKFLICSYVLSCDKIFQILANFQKSDQFVFIQNINPLPLLISTLIGLSSIERLNSSVLNMRAFSIESTSFKFVFIILTLTIFTNFELTSAASNYEGDASNDDIEGIYNLYILLGSEPNISDFCIKKSLYYTWLYGLLPFCRQAAILFYQLFDRKPAPSLTTKKSPSPSLLIKELLNYLEIPSDLKTLLYSNEIEIFKRYVTKSSAVLLCLGLDS